MGVWRRLWLAGAALLWAGSAVLAQDIGGPGGAGSTAGEVPAPPPGPNVTVISGVPSYEWYHGCGPTALGMIVGYWDAHGFPNLIPGPNDWDTNRQAVLDMIASPGHIRDYVPYPDREATPEDPYHADDSVADFTHTSRDPLLYGWSTYSFQGRGIRDYAVYRGYAGSLTFERTYTWLWGPFVGEIDAGRPVEFLVDTDADSRTDHFVTVIGYDSTPGELKYACYTTWDHQLRWFPYRQLGAGTQWGVYAGVFFEPVPEPALLLPLTLLIALLRRRHRAA